MSSQKIPARPAPHFIEELPETLLDFMLHDDEKIDRPAKRLKVGTTQSNNDGSKVLGVDYIIVKRTGWTVQYLSTVQFQIGTPLHQRLVRTYGCRGPNGKSHALDILDHTSKKVVLNTPIPSEDDQFEDILIALSLNAAPWKWDGTLRTEADLELKPRGEFLELTINLRIVWDVTRSVIEICPKQTKPSSLLKILDKYFPDSSVDRAEKWTPQDFYQAAAAPSPTASDECSQLQIPGLESNLFPFQKRAVQWLLGREGVKWSSGRITRLQPDDSALPLSFRNVKDADGRPFYVSNLFGLVTLDIAPFKALEQSLKGGILSEEMGLGKTVEMISLILLHRNTIDAASLTVRDEFSGTDVRRSASTLIITPASILQQWISELERHAPSLKIIHYEGIKKYQSDNPDEDPSVLLNNLTSADVVVTTYAVLAAEIYYTSLNGEKSLRTAPKYPRPKSPLMQTQWYRVCIDEAQMIESGVSNAAVVARMIPRIYSWCVTGTPVRKDVSDLQGLLVFLRYYPYDNIKHVWTSLITAHKQDFRQLFGQLALRHSKRDVRNELKLPPQRRYVITMPFTPIEEQHYQELFTQMCEECELDAQGAPTTEDWDPIEKAEIMRSWLVRLRQTALHPEIGGRNRRALGQKDGPLRTVDQVLEVMMEQTDLSIRTDQRNLLVSKLKRGQLYENSPRVQEALDIWTEAVDESSHFVNESRKQLNLEIEKVASNKSAKSGQQELDEAHNSDEGEDDEDTEATARLGVFRNRLRTALEIQHMAVFFQANAYFQIKSDEEMTAPDSDEFVKLEKLETEGYERAKRLRQEMLREVYRRAEKLMECVAQKAANQSFTQIPEIPTNPPSGGLESRRILEQLDNLATALDAQANVLDEWRETTIQFLLRPLVDDESAGVEITGDEYEQSHKAQDEVVVFVQALRAVIADRHDAVSGQVNLLISDEVRRLLRLARKGQDAYPEKTIETLTIRQEVKPTPDMGSLRGIVADLRGLINTLRIDAENGSVRAKSELALAEAQLTKTQIYLTQQTKANSGLEREMDLFTSLMNTRLEYYRQLQDISDMVSPYEGQNNEKVVAKMLEEEDKIGKKIVAARSKRRYLEHLQKETTNPEEQRTCVICKEDFDVGALTVCGHQFCKECISLWWSSHKTCPICKRKLLQADLHDITYKPQELSIQAEEVQDHQQQRASPSSKSKKTAIYSEISKTKLAEIKNIELDGPSFTTKVDTLARHLVWLRETDPGAKSIIFSQFKDFLDVLALAFTRYRIGYSSIDRPNGVERFKQDPAIECFLLHARAHSSGLNLVNASHVFLCEPLLNTALELQAIARVDRIGQHQETNVWLYLVDGTVEESIHDLSVRRRMEHIGQSQSKGKGKARETSPTELLDAKLEEANSMELQDAKLAKLLAKGEKGGEMIPKEDLWDCLFGARGQARVVRTLENTGLRNDVVAARELRAVAAEGRVREG